MTSEIFTPSRNTFCSSAEIPITFESEARIRSRCETTPTSSPFCTTGRWRTWARSMISLTIQRVSSAEMRTTFLFITERTATIGLSYHVLRSRVEHSCYPGGDGRSGRFRRAGAAPARAARGVLPGGREARRAARPDDVLHHGRGGPARLRRVRALGLDRLPEPAEHGRARRAARA